MPTKQVGQYEFGSPTFKRLDAASPPAVAAAAATTDTDTSIQVQQQPTQAPPLLQVAKAQNNQQPATNLMPIQAGANAIAALLSNTQRQINNQQHHISSPSQTSVLNQSTCQPNACTSSILQNIVGSNQQPLSSQNSVPSQQPVLNHFDASSYLQPSQQNQLPDPNINPLNTILSYVVAGQQMPSAQLMGTSPLSPRSNAFHALTGFCGLVLPQHTLPHNTNTSAPMSQPNNMTLQTLLMLIHQVGEEELQRRAQVDAIQNAIMTSIGRTLGQDGFSNNNIVQTQQGMLPPSRQQTRGSNNNDNTVQPQQVGMYPPSVGDLNIPADSIAATLQAARRGEAAGYLEEDDDRARNGPDAPPFSRRKRRSSSDDASDDDSWNERLRPRKKSSRK